MKKYLVLLLLAFPVYGEVTLGIVTSIYDSQEVEPGTGLRGTIGTNNVYGFIEHGAPTLRLFGQGMGKVSSWCIGPGFRHWFSDRFAVYSEIGYCRISNTPGAIQMAEVVTETFRQNHTAESWWPFGVPLDFDNELYWLEDNALTAGVGLRFDIIRNLSAEFGWRFMAIEEHYRAWNGAAELPSTTVADTCNCLLLRNTVLGMNRFYVSLLITF